MIAIDQEIDSSNFWLKIQVSMGSYPYFSSHISLDLNVRGCVKFDSILMRNVTKIGVSSSFGVLGSIKQKLIFLTQNQLHKVIFLESDKTQSKILFHRPFYNLILVRIRHLEYSLSQLLLSFGHKIALIESAISI